MCKLSMKDLPRDVVDPKSHELRSKLLSLQLQLTILQNAGPVFKSDPLFIDVVIKYLCVALSKNGVSHIPDVFERALAIFLALVQNFRVHLKMQIEVFFKEILLSMLEISTSSYQHKWLVLVTLTKIAGQPQTVVDLYLNYDCDEYLNNVFERMVNDLARVAQGRASSEVGGTAQQETKMKVTGLECLVLVTRALMDWTKQRDEPELEHDEDSGRDSAAPLAEDEDEEAGGGGAGAVRPPSPDAPDVDELDDFDARKKKKELREMGIKKFNVKPKKGIAFLQEHGLLGKDAVAIAAWLHMDERLDKTQIGEYLGDPAQFNLDVMHAYSDQCDFGELPEYVDALRLFLGGFRLPGEAQKIDRSVTYHQPPAHCIQCSSLPCPCVPVPVLAVHAALALALALLFTAAASQKRGCCCLPNGLRAAVHHASICLFFEPAVRPTRPQVNGKVCWRLVRRTSQKRSVQFG
jgi:brefeldin A-inhibited guanine nucleotide-exchange protein